MPAQVKYYEERLRPLQAVAQEYLGPAESLNPGLRKEGEWLYSSHRVINFQNIEKVGTKLGNY